MRKVTETTVKAFINAQSISVSNSTVKVLPNVTVYELFGNEIAYRYNDPEKTLMVTHAGYKTNTTKDRLNAILQELNIGTLYQNKGSWYIKLYSGNTIEWITRDIEFTQDEKGNYIVESLYLK